MTVLTVSVAVGAGGPRTLLESADEAVARIPSNATVAVGGSGSLLQVPESLLAALERRFVETRSPTGLEVLHVMGLGDTNGRGVDHLAHDGLVRRFIGSHFVLSPREQDMIAENRVEALGIPAGSLSLLYREIAARRPGLFTDIGLGTFVDPRSGGGRLNDVPTRAISQIVELGGEPWIHYPRFDIDVALLRGSTVDELGNVSMDDEAAFSDNLALAQAVHNSGGIVIVEVLRRVDAGRLPASTVRIPGALVDVAVLTDWPNITPTTLSDPRRTGVDPADETSVASLALDARKLVARRALCEIADGDVVNLGVGMANGISYCALEEGLLSRFALTIEQGVYGGLPGIGLESGTAINPTAIIDMPSQFDFYDGGGLDFAGLAFAQVDAAGNVNVAKVGGRPIGPGGFIDISQKAATVVFCGTLRGGGGQVRITEDGVEPVREGRYAKFVPAVESVAFNADDARRRGQRVVYVTERAVFELTASGIELTEIAPGLDLERDVIAGMGFRPAVSAVLRTMDLRLFRLGTAGIVLRTSKQGRHDKENSDE